MRMGRKGLFFFFTVISFGTPAMAVVDFIMVRQMRNISQAGCVKIQNCSLTSQTNHHAIITHCLPPANPRNYNLALDSESYAWAT